MDGKADLVFESFPHLESLHTPAHPWECCVLGLGEEVDSTQLAGTVLQQALYYPCFTSVPILWHSFEGDNRR